MSNRSLLRIVCIGLFLLLLISMNASFFLWVDNVILAVFEICLILVMKVFLNNNKESSNKSSVYAFAAISLFFVGLFNRSGSIVSIIGSLLVVTIMYLLMRFPQEPKRIILKFTTKWFSLLLLISVVAWLINLVVPLPSFGTVQYLDGKEGQSINYLFFTQLPYDTRFKSVFLEPGHVSTVASFFVIANRFNFKNKYVLILSLAIIPTFGLAGYMIFAIGFLFFSIERVKVASFFKRFIPMVLLVGMAVNFFSSYRGGDNLFNQLILDRLTYDNERVIVGNDRSNYVIDQAFEKAWKDGSIVAGLSKEEYEHMMSMGAVGAGVKPFMLEHGIMGTFFLFLGYFFVSRKSMNRRWATFLFLIYVISFLQRAYFFWAGYYIPYICGMFFFVKDLKMRSNENRTNQRSL